MIKTTKTKTFDTETATVVKKVTYSYYGDPAGYETTMFVSPEGDYFLYTFGGCESAYAQEKITYFAKKKALAWLENN